jgi:hypothetical protein
VRARLAARLAHAAHALFVILLCAAAFAAADRWRGVVDLSADARHSLSAASRAALAALPAPVIVTAQVASHHAARTAIETLVARYQRVRPDLAIVYEDPARAALRTPPLHDSELLVTAGTRSERVGRFTEQAFTQALLRLLRQDSTWIAFTTGHGERSPLRGANFDLSLWAEVLGGRGYRVQELNLAEHAKVPDNTGLLVIASARLPFLPGELRVVTDYLARGGALLWLLEPDQPDGFEDLAAALGLTPGAATVIDPEVAALDIDNPAFALLTRYPDHAVTDGLRAATLLPYATPIAAAIPVAQPDAWRATVLLVSGARAWADTSGRGGAAATFRPGRDVTGPLDLGWALTRTRDGHTQRVAAIGDGDFLSNTYIGNGANQDLGTRLVDWLTAADALVGIESRIAPDVGLTLAAWQQAVIGFGFLIVFPLGFLANGFLRERQRRRA